MKPKTIFQLNTAPAGKETAVFNFLLKKKGGLRRLLNWQLRLSPIKQAGLV
jgi:hypothetical protein